MAVNNDIRKVVLIDGVRTPFQKSGSGYSDLMAYQLGQYAIQGLMQRNALNPTDIDAVILGTTVHNMSTHNVARESALAAGIPATVPANTVSMACVSGNKAIADAVDQIQLGRADVIIAGGTDSTSDVPITFSKEMRQKLFATQKFKGPTDWLQFASSIRPDDFKPQIPEIAEFSTGRTMGEDSDRMADRLSISREAQDEFAVRSHQLAAAAEDAGYLGKSVIPVEVPPTFEAIETDNGIRGDSTLEKAASLKPAFNKPYGTHTAANSSFLTDGAAVVLLMSEARALALGLQPMATIVAYSFTAQDPEQELLLGPAYAIPKVLQSTGLSTDDMDVIEIHEAFAGQVLSNLKLIGDSEFAEKTMPYKPSSLQALPMDKINTWGGSLSLGHPFGATGARLVTMAAQRLQQVDGKYALVASCAAGGHGHAMILEKYSEEE